MKKHPPSIFGSEIWKEIDFIFWREPIPCLPQGTSPDGINPIGIETTKRGVEISGTIWLLPSESYDLSLYLLRPGFSSIESVTVPKLRKSVIIDSTLEGGVLSIAIDLNEDA